MRATDAISAILWQRQDGATKLRRFVKSWRLPKNMFRLLSWLSFIWDWATKKSRSRHLSVVTQPTTCRWGTLVLTLIMTRCAPSLAFKNSFAKSACPVEKVRYREESHSGFNQPWDS